MTRQGDGRDTAAEGRGALSRVRPFHIGVLLAVAAVAAALVFLASSLVRAYDSLKNAIQQERIDYVSEISDQIITSQRFMKQAYASTLENYASILNGQDINGLEDVRRYITSKHTGNFLLVSMLGSVIDLDGKALFLPDRQLMLRLSQREGIIQLFTTLSNIDDYWLFAMHIDPIPVKDEEYGAIVLAVPAGEYRENLTISLFDSRGASYIIKNDGSIEIKPLHSNNVFSGYNLFSGMMRQGARQEDVARLQEQTAANRTGSMLIPIEGEDWLFSFDSIDEENAIVVAVPLAITAAQTYAGLSKTIVYAVLIVVLVAISMIALISGFSYRDRKRRRIVLAAEAKNDFFSKMSHDIRTPLNAIIGLQTLANDSNDIAVVKQYLAQSSASSAYLLSIINDVLDMSSIDSGKLQLTSKPFNMNEVVTNVAMLISSMAVEKSIAFDVKKQGAVATYYLGDAVRMKQVLVNLLNNAVKFTKPGGHITLSVSSSQADSEADTVTIVITDTGIGMSKEYMTRIFTPFEQERSSRVEQTSGSGLGLAIVKSLVTLMGGKIKVDSTPGLGPRFTLTIPFTRGEPLGDAPPDDAPKLLSFPGKRVLLAEDNVINQQIAATILARKFNIVSEIAPDGEQAVRMFAASQPGYYDLILMDVKMPVMDGLEATRRIRALPRPDAARLPIISLSANAFAEDVALSMDAGMDGHLPKPLDVAALGDMLARFLQDNAPPPPRKFC